VSHVEPTEIPRQRGVIAVDIGGTKLAAAVVLEDGAIVVRDRIATPVRDPWSALSALLIRIRAAASDIDIVACGAGCGGPMQPHGAQVSPLHIPGWRDFPLAAALGELLAVQSFVDNDAKAFALGEGWRGAARGCRNFIAIIVGTGVGGGLVVDGRLLDGNSTNAGHVGHVIVEPDGRPCRCGALGCLEAYASGVAVEEETGQQARYAKPVLVQRNGALLGRAIASVAALTSIEMAVVGGGIGLGWGDSFLDAAGREFAERSRLSFTKPLKIVPAGLGPHSGLVGAAALAWKGLGELQGD
jgi:glucokinase